MAKSIAASFVVDTVAKIGLASDSAFTKPPPPRVDEKKGVLVPRPFFEANARPPPRVDEKEQVAAAAPRPFFEVDAKESYMVNPTMRGHFETCVRIMESLPGLLNAIPCVATRNKLLAAIVFCCEETSFALFSDHRARLHSAGDAHFYPTSVASTVWFYTEENISMVEATRLWPVMQTLIRFIRENDASVAWPRAVQSMIDQTLKNRADRRKHYETTFAAISTGQSPLPNGFAYDVSACQYDADTILSSASQPTSKL